MSCDQSSNKGRLSDDIIPIEGDGIDLSALSCSGFFGCSAFETQQISGGPSPAAMPCSRSDNRITLKSFASLDPEARLPLRVKLLKGAGGNFHQFSDSSSSSSSDDIYDIHVIRALKTVTVCSALGLRYHISRDSVVRAAVVQGRSKPSSCDGDMNSSGCVRFSRVANVVAANPMPVMLCACKSYAGSSPATSIEENETLAVLGVTFFKGYKYLRVYSFSGKREKRLPLICNGEFTTLPGRTHVPLVELLDHVRDLRLSRVAFFPEVDAPNALPPVFFSQTFLVTDFGTTTALAGIPYGGNESSDMVEFSSELKVEVVLLPINRDSHQSMTHSVAEKYEQKRSHYFVTESGDLERSEKQDECALVPGMEEYDDSELASEMLLKCSALEEMISTLKTEVNLLSEQLVQMESSHNHIESSSLQHLQRLTHEQVQEYLGEVGLPQYKSCFAKEFIDGLVLVEMDEEMWRIDLGIQEHNDWLKLRSAMGGKKIC